MPVKTFYPNADAYMSSASPTANTNNTELWEGESDLYSAWYTAMAVNFDLAFQRIGILTACTLSLYVTGHIAGSNFTNLISADPFTSSWTETGITWNTTPGRAASIGSVSSNNNKAVGWRTMNLDLNTMTNFLRTPSSFYGFYFGSSGTNSLLKFSSRTGGQPPQLTITYTEPRTHQVHVF